MLVCLWARAARATRATYPPTPEWRPGEPANLRSLYIREDGILKRHLISRIFLDKFLHVGLYVIAWIYFVSLNLRNF